MWDIRLADPITDLGTRRDDISQVDTSLTCPSPSGTWRPEDALAVRWANEAASGLTAQVDAEPTEFTFDLK
jgi:hypothetical protein